ncbi:hypothetical protein Tco_0946435 [Tanacetum coccineum]
MPPKRTSTSAAPAMTQAAIRQLVADSVAAALEAQAANMEILTILIGTLNQEKFLQQEKEPTITNESLIIEGTPLPTATTTTTPTIATTTTTKITTTITTVTTITSNSRIEGQKLSELMLSPQLRTKVSDLQQGGSSDEEQQKQKTSHGKQPAITCHACEEEGHYKNQC